MLRKLLLVLAISCNACAPALVKFNGPAPQLAAPQPVCPERTFAQPEGFNWPPPIDTSTCSGYKACLTDKQFEAVKAKIKALSDREVYWEKFYSEQTGVH